MSAAAGRGGGGEAPRRRALGCVGWAGQAVGCCDVVAAWLSQPQGRPGAARPGPFPAPRMGRRGPRIRDACPRASLHRRRAILQRHEATRSEAELHRILALLRERVGAAARLGCTLALQQRVLAWCAVLWVDLHARRSRSTCCGLLQTQGNSSCHFPAWDASLKPLYLAPSPAAEHAVLPDAPLQTRKRAGAICHCRRRAARAVARRGAQVRRVQLGLRPAPQEGLGGLAAGRRLRCCRGGCAGRWPVGRRLHGKEARPAIAPAMLHPPRLLPDGCHSRPSRLACRATALPKLLLSTAPRCPCCPSTPAAWRPRRRSARCCSSCGARLLLGWPPFGESVHACQSGGRWPPSPPDCCSWRSLPESGCLPTADRPALIIHPASPVPHAHSRPMQRKAGSGGASRSRGGADAHAGDGARPRLPARQHARVGAADAAHAGCYCPAAAAFPVAQPGPNRGGLPAVAASPAAPRRLPAGPDPAASCPSATPATPAVRAVVAAASCRATSRCLMPPAT